MKINISKIKRFALPLFFIFLGSIFALGSSPIYVTNPWDDTNAMLTMGRALTHGIIPFKDLVDQRGPILYFLFSFASLIKGNSFFGVFFIELINLLIVYFLTYRILQVIGKSSRQNEWYSLIGPIILIGNSTFNLGGAPEEFAFTSVLFLFYVIIRFNHDLLEINERYLFLLGLNFAIVFWNKYSMAGPFLVFFLLLSVHSVNKMNFREFIKNKFLPAFYGFASISFIIILFFLFSGGLVDLIKVYFIENLSYGHTPGTLIHRYFSTMSYITIIVGRHIYILFMIFVGWFIASREKVNIFPEIYITVGSILVMAIPQQYTDYYNMIWLPVLIVSVIRIMVKIFNRNELDTNLIGKYAKFLIVIMLVCLPFSNNIDLGRLIVKGNEKARDYGTRDAQKQFGEIMNFKKHDKHPSLVMLNSLDDGFFLSAKTLPTTRYWHKLNMTRSQMPEMYEDFNKTLKYEKVEFVVVKLNERPAMNIKRLKKQVVQNVDDSLQKNLQQNYDISAIASNRDNIGYVLLQNKKTEKNTNYLSTLN